MPDTVRGRYAPSPTGDLHLGNIRTALVAWLGARAQQGTFILRIEDLDTPRVRPGAEAQMLEDLSWLGLDWDEGPDVGGPYAPYRQSERHDHYERALTQLDETGRLYGCSCSRADLKRLASAPHGPLDEGPVYPGICRSRQIDWQSQAGTTARARIPAVRFQVSTGAVRFDDLLAGSVSQDVKTDVGDFVVRRADGIWAYQLAVVVDDWAMGINQVVRGADLLHSTPRQLQLLQALGAPPPAYAHVPLTLDEKGQRLAKREGAATLRALREQGWQAQDLVGILAHSLGLLPTPEPCVPRDLVASFEWARVATTAWRAHVPELGRSG
ncbi:MAG: tRNA glutamyl-Q(34) synthetase GluQRS [Candidatus Sericytochromatia bacterium]|nr:tRNA glutamyl-Q(34) synthetase GluQRS [Candidatus Sericytochromatia bacterium]